MPIDFTSFISPYQRQFNSSSDSSSFNQMMANKAAMARQREQLKAQGEQEAATQTATTERERMKLQAQSDEKLEEKRRDFAKRFAEASKLGDATQLQALAPEAEVLGWKVKREKGGSGRTDPNDPLARLNPLQAPDAYDVVRIEDGEGTGVAAADVGETRYGNQQQIKEAVKHRLEYIEKARPEDYDAEMIGGHSLYDVGHPLSATSFEDSAGMNNRAARQREAEANRDAAASLAAASRAQRAGEHEDNVGLRLREIEDREKKAEEKKVKDDSIRLGRWKGIASSSAKSLKVGERRELINAAGKTLAMVDSPSGLTQKLGRRSLSILFNKGALTDADAEAVNSPLGIIEKYKQKLESGATNDLSDEEKKELKTAISTVIVVLDDNQKAAYESLKAEAGGLIDDPIAAEAYQQEMDKLFTHDKFYQEAKANRPVVDTATAEEDDADSFEQQLRKEHGD